MSNFPTYLVRIRINSKLHTFTTVSGSIHNTDNQTLYRYRLRSCDTADYILPSLANVVSTTPVRPPGTLCHLTYMTLLTRTYSRNDLKLFCLIIVVVRRSWTVRRAAPYKSLIEFVFVPVAKATEYI